MTIFYHVTHAGRAPAASHFLVRKIASLVWMLEIERATYGYLDVYSSTNNQDCLLICNFQNADDGVFRQRPNERR